jgi:hypothetical protein
MPFVMKKSTPECTRLDTQMPPAKVRMGTAISTYFRLLGHRRRVLRGVMAGLPALEAAVRNCANDFNAADFRTLPSGVTQKIVTCGLYRKC